MVQSYETTVTKLFAVAHYLGGSTMVFTNMHLSDGYSITTTHTFVGGQQLLTGTKFVVIGSYTTSSVMVGELTQRDVYQ